MTQQYKKIRPSRAARAREKSRTPNIPEFTGPDDWERTGSQGEPPARVGFGAGANVAAGERPAASPFARAARNNSMEITHDYSYLSTDLMRLTWTTLVLLAGMIALALIYR